MSNLIIGAVVTIVVGLVLYPVVSGSVETAKETNKAIIKDPNSTKEDISQAKSNNTMLGLITLGYILLLLFGSGALFYFGARSG